MGNNKLGIILIAGGLWLCVALFVLNIHHKQQEIKKQQQWIKDSIQIYEDMNRAGDQYMERLKQPR